MTPLRINILLHYWSRSNDYNNGDFSPPAINEAIHHFAALGLLLPGAVSDQYCPAKYHGNREALAPYVETLCAVPLPVQQWVVPQASAA